MKPIEKLCWRVGFAIFGLILLANMHGCGSMDKSMGPLQYNENKDVRLAAEPARVAAKVAVAAKDAFFFVVPSQGAFSFFPFPDAEVRLSKSISGRPLDFQWYTTISPTGISGFAIKDFTPGYYVARVYNSGVLVGQWGSIPLNHAVESERIAIFLPSGGLARVGQLYEEGREVAVKVKLSPLGEAWQVVWSLIDMPDEASISIALVFQGLEIRTLAMSLENTGHWRWVVPDLGDIGPGADFQVRVVGRVRRPDGGFVKYEGTSDPFALQYPKG